MKVKLNKLPVGTSFEYNRENWTVEEILRNGGHDDMAVASCDGLS